MKFHLDHIGIAVRSLAESIPLWKKFVEADGISIMEIPEEKVKICMLYLPNTKIELLEPLSDDSTIKKFIDRHGEGIHHIALRSDDAIIELLMESLLNEGMNIINKSPVNSADGKAFFIHPKSLNGTLVEILEMDRTNHSQPL